MCRLYAFRANRPTRVDCSLIRAQQTLLTQTSRDPLGRTHPDGWGIGYFQSGHPIVQRRAGQTGGEAINFRHTAEHVCSQTVITHVRVGTIGVAGVHNCHPFRWGSWMLAHEGTLTAEAKLRSEMEAEMGDEFAALLHGTTDSELLFHWLISRLRSTELMDAEQCFDLDRLRDELAERIAEIDGRNQGSGPADAATLNLVLTNGEILIASHLRGSLYWSRHRGVQVCQVCGERHVAPADREDDYQITIIASQPLSDEGWQPLAEGTVMAVDRDGSTTVTSLPA